MAYSATPHRDGSGAADAGGSTTMSLRVPQPAGRRTFFADSEMTGGGIPPILYFKAQQVPQGDDPLVVSGNPDLLVVTHPNFRGSALDRWVSHRVVRRISKVIVVEIGTEI